MLDTHGLLDELVVLGGLVTDHETATDRVELLCVDIGLAGAEDREAHPVGVERQLLVGGEDDVAIGDELDRAPPPRFSSPVSTTPR